ncbi:hypothetical protein QQ020_20935 [Fulvivirgaceae bacterium BMA12]|uniref:Uncharacterized protein n=1 Tax=Agaribacillus aureus TaxID=3051825 RepID=A0ABT8L9Y1_9BACT|nr:hypothetical protein [Fulvivirgaceae bacterium BMA12]
MELLLNLIFILAIFNFLLLAVGLYRPWIVLWWRRRQNRLQVIRLYGTLGAGLLLLAFFLSR